jgi:tetratricopeptide (TPR) repeat protein
MLRFVVSPDDVALSEHELSAERVEIDSLVGGHAQADGQARHSGQLQQSEIVCVPDPASMYHEGLTLKESREYTKAIWLFDKLSKQDSWAIRALAQKGLCLKAMGQHDDAITTIREAASYRPATRDESVAVQYLLARTLESHRRYDEAREVYVALDRGQRKYRDVSARLARLQDEDQDFGLAEDKQATRFASFWRGCGQLLRNIRG